jgi:hypothetical protein
MTAGAHRSGADLMQIGIGIEIEIEIEIEPQSTPTRSPDQPR